MTDTTMKKCGCTKQTVPGHILILAFSAEANFWIRSSGRKTRDIQDSLFVILTSAAQFFHQSGQFSATEG